MKKFLAVVQWMVETGAFFVVLGFGFVNDIKGLQNIAILYVWMGVLISLCFLADSSVRRLAGVSTYPEVPRFMTGIVTMISVVVFVWYGCWFTAVAKAFQCLILDLVFDKVVAMRKEGEKA